MLKKLIDSAFPTIQFKLEVLLVRYVDCLKNSDGYADLLDH